jgi:GNAT superfamily N-acetyltransferase
MTRDLDARLRLHLRTWLGRWPAFDHPAPSQGAVRPGLVDVVGSVQRTRPGWDGRTFPILAVGSPASAVLSVPPGWAAILRERVAAALIDSTQWTDIIAELPAVMNRPDSTVYNGVYRFCTGPADLADAGVWVPADRPDVPDWLRPFGREALIAFDPATGGYLAGVGIKRHDRYGHEIAVTTEPEARGQGLARRLVAQAARRIIADGAVPTYQHDPANLASAAVARAAGFPDLGWRSLGLP